VRDEITKIMGFWLELGVSGFRVDAVPFLIETDGMTPEDAEAFDEPHDSCATCASSSAASRRGDPARRGQPAAYPAAEFFGGASGDELDDAVRLRGMQSMYLAWPAATPVRCGVRLQRPPDRAVDARSGRCSCATTTS
jgi:hypothetical protein